MHYEIIMNFDVFRHSNCLTLRWLSSNFKKNGPWGTSFLRYLEKLNCTLTIKHPVNDIYTRWIAMKRSFQFERISPQRGKMAFWKWPFGIIIVTWKFVVSGDERRQIPVNLGSNKAFWSGTSKMLLSLCFAPLLPKMGIFEKKGGKHD